MWQKSSCEQICLCPHYSKSHKTGSGHAADSKLRYSIQFSILMLCAKYQEAGLCGSWEKCDRNYLVSNFAYVHDIQSRVKQEVDMPQIQKCVTQYSSPYWCAVSNIKKAGLCGSREKCDRNFLWHRRRRQRKTTDSDPYMSPTLKRAGDTKTLALTVQN